VGKLDREQLRLPYCSLPTYWSQRDLYSNTTEDDTEDD